MMLLIFKQNHCGRDSEAEQIISPFSPTSWDYGPCKFFFVFVDKLVLVESKKGQQTAMLSAWDTLAGLTAKVCKVYVT